MPIGENSGDNIITKKLRVEIEATMLGVMGVDKLKHALRDFDLSGKKAAAERLRGLKAEERATAALYALKQRLERETLMQQQANADKRIAAEERYKLKVRQTYDLITRKEAEIAAMRERNAALGAGGGLGTGAFGLGRFAKPIGMGAAAVGAAALYGGYRAVAANAQWRSYLSQTQGMSRLTGPQMGIASNTAWNLATQMGANPQDIISAYRYGSDYGFGFGLNQRSIRAATRTALPLGGKPSDWLLTIGTVGRNFPAYRNDPNAIANMVLEAGRYGRTDPNVFAASVSRSLMTAGHFHNNALMPQTLAAVSALSIANGGDAQEASMLYYNMLSKIAAPSPGVVKNLAFLKRRTGIDLAPYMGDQALTTKGLTGILGAFHQANLTPGALKHLFPDIRAWQAMMALSGNQYGAYTGAVPAITNAPRMDPAGQNYRRYMGQLTTDMAKLGNTFGHLANTIGGQLEPSVHRFIRQGVIPLIQGLDRASSNPAIIGTVKTVMNLFTFLEELNVRDLNFQLGLLQGAFDHLKGPISWIIDHIPGLPHSGSGGSNGASSSGAPRGPLVYRGAPWKTGQHGVPFSLSRFGRFTNPQNDYQNRNIRYEAEQFPGIYPFLTTPAARASYDISRANFYHSTLGGKGPYYDTDMIYTGKIFPGSQLQKGVHGGAYHLPGSKDTQWTFVGFYGTRMSKTLAGAGYDATGGGVASVWMTPQGHRVLFWHSAAFGVPMKRVGTSGPHGGMFRSVPVDPHSSDIHNIAYYNPATLIPGHKYAGGTTIGLTGREGDTGPVHLCIVTGQDGRQDILALTGKGEEAYRRAGYKVQRASNHSGKLPGLNLPTGEAPYGASFAGTGAKRHIDPAVLAGVGMVEWSGNTGARGAVLGADGVYHGTMGVNTKTYGLGPKAQIGGAGKELRIWIDWAQTHPAVMRSLAPYLKKYGINNPLSNQAYLFAGLAMFNAGYPLGPNFGNVVGGGFAYAAQVLGYAKGINQGRAPATYYRPPSARTPGGTGGTGTPWPGGSASGGYTSYTGSQMQMVQSIEQGVHEVGHPKKALWGPRGHAYRTAVNGLAWWMLQDKLHLYASYDGPGKKRLIADAWKEYHWRLKNPATFMWHQEHGQSTQTKKDHAYWAAYYASDITTQQDRVTAAIGGRDPLSLHFTRRPGSAYQTVATAGRHMARDMYRQRKAELMQIPGMTSHEADKILGGQGAWKQEQWRVHHPMQFLHNQMAAGGGHAGGIIAWHITNRCKAEAEANVHRRRTAKHTHDTSKHTKRHADTLDSHTPLLQTIAQNTTILVRRGAASSPGASPAPVHAARA